MKLKFSKKYYWVNIGSTIGLATIGLCTCTPILIACNNNDDDENDDDGGNGENNDNHQHVDDQIDTNEISNFDANYVFDNCLANNNFLKNIR